MGGWTPTTPTADIRPRDSTRATLGWLRVVRGGNPGHPIGWNEGHRRDRRGCRVGGGCRLADIEPLRPACSGPSVGWGLLDLSAHASCARAPAGAARRGHGVGDGRVGGWVEI